MDRITYVKYNSSRKPEYRIATEIHEDGQNKWVVKRPRDDAAQKHINRIVDNRKMLKKVYKNISVLDVVKENGYLRFPYVAGKVLDEKIYNIKLEKEEFIQQVNCLFDLILDVQDGCKCRFEPTEGFYAHFGKTCPDRGIPALCPVNLDSLFSNFIETENGLICLDYEWVYDFPIPVDFIKYRTLRYFYNEREKSMFRGISRDSVMEWFGFNREIQDLYWSMESFFQQQIYGENWRYIYLNRYKKEELTLQMLDELIERQNNIILYNEACIRDRDASIRDKDTKLQTQDELIERQNKIILYNEACIRDRDASIQAKDASIQNKESSIRALENEMRSREKEILELKQKNNEQELLVEEWMSNYSIVINSTSWRLTKPLRSIGTFIRCVVKKQ